jgi:hypothetical protein
VEDLDLSSCTSGDSHHDLQAKEITQAVRLSLFYIYLFLSLLQIMVTIKIKGGSGWYLSLRVAGREDSELLSI